MRFFAFFLFSFLIVTFGTAYASGPHADVQKFYKDDIQLFWTGERQIERNKEKIPEILKEAIKHGLDPEKYHASDIEKFLDHDLSKEDSQQFDYVLTYVLWRYASDLAGRSLGKDEFLDMTFKSGLKENIDALAPQTPLYHVLQDRLHDIRELIEREDIPAVYKKVSFGEKSLKVGDTHPDVPILRAKMISYGAEESFGDDPYTYDLLLSEAVKKFQESHGLDNDGVIGPATLALMNFSLEDEKQKIILNMDRLRQAEWRNRPDLRIDVDISRYWLSAYEGGDVAFEMPVVVGSETRQTERFSTIMTGVRLNPGWTLPPTIKAEDYIPKLRENPQILNDRGIMIYADWAPDSEPIDPTTVDWSLLTDNEIKAMRMYKTAGTENPLGQYRFFMNNKHDIYLHDTNKKYLFSHSMRAKSSGCVRVYDPKRIAEFLLKDDAGWDSDKIDEFLEKGETYDLGAHRKIPVYFDYKTVWLDKDGALVFAADIYNLDDSDYHDMIKRQDKVFDTISPYFNSMSLSDKINEEKEEDKSGDIFPISLF